MDVKTTFLNGDLDEKIYMEQPEEFDVLGQEKKVCRLVKSLYGLKQAPMQWHEKFDSVMMTNGFKINECDKCVYVKNTERGFVIICLYVDDILIMGSNNEVIKTTKEMFNNKFDMKDLGVANVILGIKISKTSDGLILSQSHYIEKILKKFKQNDSSPMRTPVDVNLHLSKNNGKSLSQQEYAQAIGSLMYVMNCTRPDIAYAVSKLSRYTSNPGLDHWKAIVRVLRYLKYTQIMDCTTQNIQQYLKDTVMRIGYPTPKTRSPQVAIYLHLVVERCLGNLLRKRALLDPRWNLSLLHWIKLVKK